MDIKKHIIPLLLIFFAIIILFIAIILAITTRTEAQEKYLLPCKEYLFELRMDSLKTQVGIKEKTGNNDGEVYKYQKPFRLKNQPYCKMLQDWAFLVNLRDKKDAPYKFNPLAISLYGYAKKNGISAIYKGNIGDLLIWNNKGTITGHIECIDSVMKRGNVRTIAGNTSNGKAGSQREGNGIYRRNRNIKHPLSRILVIKGIVGFTITKNITNKQGCNIK